MENFDKLKEILVDVLGVKAEDVKVIKTMLSKGIKQKIIARMFCISEMQITRIKQGVNWQEVEIDE